MRFLKFCMFCMFCVFVLSTTLVAAQEEPVTIMVTGKQPGPPMWRVINGENELYIFAGVSYIPEGMIWESDKVEAVIARAQEVISPPDVNVKPTMLLMLNPINYIRGYRLAKRITKHPDGDTLEEILPAELYARFSALKTQYFPKNKKIEKSRPLIASGQMRQIVIEAEGMVPAQSVNKKLRKLIKKNKEAIKTSVEVEHKLEGGFGDLAERVENLMSSLTAEKEIACFEAQLNRLEYDIEEMKYRTDAWARGYIDEFKGISLAGDNDDPCVEMLMASTEKEFIEMLQNEVNANWISAAKNALENNKTTFATLNITELLRSNGLMFELQQLGYDVREP